MKVAIVLFCLFGPLLVMWLTHCSRFLRKVGDIILAYIIGCAVGLTGLLDDGESANVLTTIATASVPFAIPLMLLSSDARQWQHLAPSFAKSMVLGIVGCIIAITIGFMLYGRDDSEMNAKVGGMLTGLYTGGTANQASLKIALGIPDDTYLLSHAYSIVVSAIYLLFVIVFGRRVLGLFLPPFRDKRENMESKEIVLESHEDELFYGLFTKSHFPSLMKSIGLTAAILAIGGGVSLGISKLLRALGYEADVFQALFILVISLLSVIAGMDRRVRALPRTYEAGTYFILVFSLAVSSQVNTEMLSNVTPDFFAYISIATLGALVFHALLNAIFRIDVDTTLVSSISLICSPPFVPVMAGALGNKSVIGPGIAVGLIGYATGTYIGFGVAQMLLFLAHSL